WIKKDYIDEFYRIAATRKTEWPDGAAKRQNALWVLTRIASPDAQDAVRLGLADADTAVRCVALQSASLHRDRKAADLAQPPISIYVVPSEERPYFELLGRTGKCDDLPIHTGLMVNSGSLRPDRDRILQHSFTYALVESGNAKSARQFLGVRDDEELG